MKEKITFGECLSVLFDALNLKTSKVARGINVDSSLIYKWLRNERVPAYETSYIELISNYLSKSICNSFQKEAVVRIFQKYGKEAATTIDDVDLSNKISSLLFEAQGYSLQHRNELGIRKKKSQLSDDNPYFRPLSLEDNTRDSDGFSDQLLHNVSKILNQKHFYASDKTDIIMGRMEVMYSILSLLNQIQKKPDTKDNTIYISLNSTLRLQHGCRAINTSWLEALHRISNYGWNILFKIRLDTDVRRTINIIEDLQMLLTIGKLAVYYDHRSDFPVVGNDMYLTPNKGALICFSSHIRDQIDSAFWFHSRDSYDLLAAHFNQYLDMNNSLFIAYSPNNALEYLQDLTETEEISGSRFSFSCGLNSLTMPASYYQKYLKLSGKPETEISWRMFLHQRRIAAFEEQVIYYPQKDICILEPAMQLFLEQDYCNDDLYGFAGAVPEMGDLILWLEHTIHMLEHYNNYEIAFISESAYKNIGNVNWTLKENYAVMLESRMREGQEHSPIDFYSISEEHFVQSFHDYFNKIWNSIPVENKTKRSSIKYIKSLIKKCRLLQN